MRTITKQYKSNDIELINAELERIINIDLINKTEKDIEDINLINKYNNIKKITKIAELSEIPKIQQILNNPILKGIFNPIITVVHDTLKNGEIFSLQAVMSHINSIRTINI